MASKLILTCNKTNYVEEVVKKLIAWIVVDFNGQKKLVEAINNLFRNRPLRDELEKKSYIYYQSYFNWQIVTKGMYKKLSKHIRVKNSGSLYIYKSLLIKQLYLFNKPKSQKGYIVYPSGSQIEATKHRHNDKMQINRISNLIKIRSFF